MAEESPPLDSGGDAPESAPSLRDDIARAFDQVEAREVPPSAPATQPDKGSTSASPPGQSPDERPRDSSGRFVAKEEPPQPPDKAAAPPPKAAPPLAAPAPKTQPAPPQQAGEAQPSQLRAPASWKPAVREHWGKLPPEVQAEVVRLDREVQKTMKDTAGARQALEAVQQVLAPFSANIQAAGNDALRSMRELFQADHMLRHGSVAEKASLIANIVRNYGVDIGALDSALAGQAPANDPNSQLMQQLRQEFAAQLQPLQGFVNQIQGRQQQAYGQIEQDAGSAVETFGQDEKHEFFEDVREDMADLLDMASRRGRSMTLEEAYERAIKLHPAVSEIVGKRAEAERAAQAAQAAQRARRTAVSIASSPAPAGSPGPAGESLRAAVEAAWDQHSVG